VSNSQTFSILIILAERYLWCANYRTLYIYFFSEKMSETKLYAIVQFLADESFSEIPTNWIQRNNDGFICWWPNTKNISSLIKNRAEPDKKLWSRFDITVIKYCCKL